MTVSFAGFAGLWQVQREIMDDNQLGAGHFAGQAEFIAQSAGYRYVEQGVMTFAAQPPMTASQSYLWTGNDRAVEVCFSDGRAFHRIDLAQDKPQAHHFCDPDDYRVAYDFSGWPHWSSHWVVKGPRKDYEMRTTYLRL